MQKWKIRLLQGILIGGYLGAFIATKVVNDPGIPMLRVLIVAFGVAFVSFNSFCNAHYLRQKHPEKIMQEAFAESFFLKLFGAYVDQQEEIDLELQARKREFRQKVREYNDSLVAISGRRGLLEDDRFAQNAALN